MSCRMYCLLVFLVFVCFLLYFSVMSAFFRSRYERGDGSDWDVQMRELLY